MIVAHMVDGVNASIKVSQVKRISCRQGGYGSVYFAGASSKSVNPLIGQISNGPAGGFHEKIEAPVDPTKELSRLVYEHKYDEAFTCALQRSDVQIVSWLCSQLLMSHLEPLTEQQLAKIDHLQQTSLQAEEALSQGMDGLQKSLAETLISDAPVVQAGSSVTANYMGQMAIAMGKLGSLETFLHQADHLREKTLQQMHTILTIRQSARSLLAINDYFSRLRALSTLWLARPQE